MAHWSVLLVLDFRQRGADSLFETIDPSIVRPRVFFEEFTIRERPEQFGPIPVSDSFFDPTQIL